MFLRMVCCATGGAAGGFITKLWISKLQKERGFEYSLNFRKEAILIGAMAVSGCAIGALTTGVSAPVCSLLLLCVCAAVSVMDWSYRVIPNQTVLAVFGVKFISIAAEAAEGRSIEVLDIVQSLLGMLACFLVFSFPGMLGKNVGAGDIKLAAAMGFLLGTYNSLLGIVIMGAMILAFAFMQSNMPVLHFMRTTIPMGPFIAVGMMAAYVGAPLLV